jgi:hypothetical protein
LEAHGGRSADVTLVEHAEFAIPSDLTYFTYATGEGLPLRMPIFRPSGNAIDGQRIASGFYCTGDSASWTLTADQYRDFLRIQALGQISPALLQLLSPRGFVGEQRELTPKQKLLRRILASRDSIEAERGTLSESYPLIRQDRDR